MVLLKNFILVLVIEDVAFRLMSPLMRIRLSTLRTFFNCQSVDYERLFSLV